MRFLPIAKPMAWAVAWTVYGLGHLVSLIVPNNESKFALALADLYSYLMGVSFKLSEEYNLGLWKEDL